MTKTGRTPPLVKALRPYQWVKNLLVLVPVFGAHRMHEVGLVQDALLAFMCFCACASAGYVVNDLVDLESDRQNPAKRHRPFASGQATARAGILVAGGLMVVGFGVSLALLPNTFTGLLALYLVTSLTYTFFLKRVMLVDVIVLAGLYTLRILAGAAATAIELSFWMLAFAIFIFMSLAMAKRYSELHRIQQEGDQQASGRGYRVDDLPMLSSFGAASGFLSVLVFCLYINDITQNTGLYSNPMMLWLIAPLLAYWVARCWFLAGRGELHEEPVAFSIRDPVSWLVGVGVGVFVVLATVTGAANSTP